MAEACCCKRISRSATALGRAPDRFGTVTDATCQCSGDCTAAVALPEAANPEPSMHARELKNADLPTTTERSGLPDELRTAITVGD